MSTIVIPRFTYPGGTTASYTGLLREDFSEYKCYPMSLVCFLEQIGVKVDWDICDRHDCDDKCSYTDTWNPSMYDPNDKMGVYSTIKANMKKKNIRPTYYLDGVAYYHPIKCFTMSKWINPANGWTINVSLRHYSLLIILRKLGITIDEQL